MYTMRSIRLRFCHNLNPTNVRMITCWACGNSATTLLSDLFCPNCKTLQKVDSNKNYFKIMGIQETFDLNQSDLAKKFKNLQKYLHPDKYANKPKEEQEISEIYSSLVNEAYKTLLEPLSRGIYMLKLQGHSIPEETEVIDQNFLMEVMELNEVVENAESEQEILKLNQENKAKIVELHKLVSKSFYEGNYKEVVKHLIKLKYYTSIDNQIQSNIRSKGIIR